MRAGWGYKRKQNEQIIHQYQMLINRFKLWYSIMEKQCLKNKQDTLACLDSLAIKYILHDHQPVFNMDELSKVALHKSPYIKNLFYSEKKCAGYFFIFAETSTVVGRGFWKKFGTTHNNARFAKEEATEAVLRAKKGNVNPFALVNDEKKEVKKVLIDENLFNFESWSFHPMDNSATIELERADMLKFLDHFKIGYEKINLSEEAPQPEEKKEKEKEKKKEEVNLIGVDAKKEKDFSTWYAEVINRSGMLDYYDVSGCYILRPWAYGIWERIQQFFDGLIKEHGVQNAYFPMFVSKKSLQTEKEHVEGFAAEVAWVTKSGKSDLAEPIAIRPTSETIMYPAYANWIKSHRDLPLRLNQWTNIVRWEFKHPTPFIRTRQFLWQEGHTAHATFEEAEQETFIILEFYRRIYEELLAIPVCKGVKTESQKFAGGFKTTTVETWIPENGRAIQAATSHNLGQNFAKMFGIKFEDEKKKDAKEKSEPNYVWQTSWGVTTRSIGILIMQHADNKGLVLPPLVSNVQVVIVPIIMKGKEEVVMKAAEDIFGALKKAKVRVHLDDRNNYTPGWKYNHWELKGVPIRIEIGPKDVEKNKVMAVFRYNEEKQEIAWDQLTTKIPECLVEIQKGMFMRAKARFDEKLKKSDTWEGFMSEINQRNVVITPWCNNKECEEKIKERSSMESKELANEGETLLTGQAKSLCIPLESEGLTGSQKCFHCAEEAKVRVIWGRSY